MKKIIASILAVFFVVLSPLSAYAASTTESMMMFSSGFGSDDYAVMPLAVEEGFDFSFEAGSYNLVSDSFNGTSKQFTNLSNGDILTPAYAGISPNFLYNMDLRPYFGFSLGSPDKTSSVSIPNNSTLRLSVNGLIIAAATSGDAQKFVLSHDKAVPYKVYADMYFTATQQIGNTHSPTYHQQTVSLGNCFVPSQAQDSAWDIDAVIPINADTSSSSADLLYNIQLRYVKVYVVFDWSSLYVRPDLTQNVYEVLPLGTRVFVNMYINGYASTSPYSPRIFLTYESSGNTSFESSLSASTSILQNSINSVNTNLSNKINNVSNQITQTTNTITTRIQTLETNITDGLNNVISSAKENTQNIINTVTQKVDEVKTAITEVKDSILDLPNKIQEMLLGLIVPDADTMADKYSEFSGLLEEKLGVIYQIPMMLFDFFDTIVNAAITPQSTLTLPAFKLPWIDGSQLTIWNSMEYKIIPDGLEVLSDLIRTVTSMTVVVLTFNSVKQAYERFLRS